MQDGFHPDLLVELVVGWRLESDACPVRRLHVAVVCARRECLSPTYQYGSHHPFIVPPFSFSAGAVRCLVQLATWLGINIGASKASWIGTNSLRASKKSFTSNNGFTLKYGLVSSTPRVDLGPWLTPGPFLLLTGHGMLRTVGCGPLSARPCSFPGRAPSIPG